MEVWDGWQVRGMGSRGEECVAWVGEVRNVLVLEEWNSFDLDVMSVRRGMGREGSAVMGLVVSAGRFSSSLSLPPPSRHPNHTPSPQPRVTLPRVTLAAI
ncbi:hypothetical protein E2C01_058989 [Portunus trituberculatus]|uniref:Uncharacterized protein n=1 Tax=Portunus trituberculatus TaxID=210409 RepID=A0A5B7H677_PORTR|nr:hypothetical protein [Portunus trituberculatus]